jgi:hypothetical protein
MSRCLRVRLASQRGKKVMAKDRKGPRFVAASSKGQGKSNLRLAGTSTASSDNRRCLPTPPSCATSLH